MKKHVNIPIFIPHLGCPHDCVFCNQRKISGRAHADFSSVEDEIVRALQTVKDGQTAQIAYFGGSFTGIDREDMIYLLGVAKKYVDRGKVESIRLSTRPDYIDREILDILKEYGVGTVELGIQSMSDKVLDICGRGHTAQCSVRACRLIKEYGFELIGQMMTGLPGAEYEDDIMTARTIAMMCDGARIYPTVVFCDTELCEMAKRGEYAVPGEEELVCRTVGALREFAMAKKPVIRVGLQSSDGVLDERNVYSKTYHPAIGEICYSRLYREIIEEKIPRGEKDIVVVVGKREISKAVGQHGANREYLKNKFGLHSIKFEGDESHSDFEVTIHTRENKSET